MSLRCFTLLAAWLMAGALCAQTYPEAPSLDGYVKYLPSLRLSSNLDEVFFDQLVHNRINFNWQIAEPVRVHAGLRTRVFQGYNVRNVPFYRSFLEQDFGAIDASWVLFQEGSWMMHTTPDRFFVDIDKGKWRVRAGRQRINWGINMVSNPNDLFNTYSFFDFDYEERPGTDALRVQYFAGSLSRVELAVAPGRAMNESVAAMLYSANFNGYDLQAIAGYFRNRLALGGGWAGNIKSAGFKGEVTFFSDLEPVQGVEASNVVLAFSADYLFGNGMYVLVEYLFNQQRRGVEADLMLFVQPLSADNLSFTDHAVFATWRYPFSPVFSTGLAAFYFPTESGMFLSPSVEWSVRQNLDFMFISQLFMGRQGSILSQAGYLGAVVLKWSF